MADPKLKSIKNNPVLELSFDLSLAIICYCKKLNEQKEFIISNQLFRSATSIGANIFEAQNAESRADFIHKMKIAAKESKESEYWLLLCKFSKGYPEATLLLSMIDRLNRLLSKIISSAKR